MPTDGYQGLRFSVQGSGFKVKIGFYHYITSEPSRLKLNLRSKFQDEHCILFIHILALYPSNLDTKYPLSPIFVQEIFLAIASIMLIIKFKPFVSRGYGFFSLQIYQVAQELIVLCLKQSLELIG